jgi:hypothetical protein
MKYEVTIYKADTSEIVWNQIIEGDSKERIAIKAETSAKEAGIKDIMRVGKSLSNTDKRRYTFKMTQIDRTVSKALLDQLTPQERYDMMNTVRVALKLNTKTDADILARLEEVGNKQGYIKELIRKDMGR